MSEKSPEGLPSKEELPPTQGLDVPVKKRKTKEKIKTDNTLEQEKLTQILAGLYDEQETAREGENVGNYVEKEKMPPEDEGVANEPESLGTVKKDEKLLIGVGVRSAVSFLKLTKFTAKSILVVGGGMLEILKKEIYDPYLKGDGKFANAFLKTYKKMRGSEKEKK